MKDTTEVLALLRNSLTILSLIAERAGLPALVFLIGMAELEASQTAAKAKRKILKKR
jgi:hypothetical protein